MNIEDIHKLRRLNLKALLESGAYGKKQTEFAQRIGRAPAQINQWLSGHRGIADESRDLIESALGIPPGWLDQVADPSVSTAQLPAQAIDLDNNPDYPAVRRVQFRLSAGASGFGVEYKDEDSEPIVFRRDWFLSRGYVPDKLFAVRVSNGSMEPGLWAGDTVVTNTADTEPRDGEVYAVNFEGELVIKRLVRDEGRWWLKSDNADQGRYPRKVVGAGVFILGRIVHKQSEHV